MTVRILRNIHQSYIQAVAEVHITAIRRQKIGYRLPEVYSQREQIIDGILIESLVKANSSLYLNDKARLPIWADKSYFDKFISKITNYGSDYIS